ncbi:hypothetical protein TNCV_2187891 [Trichonephila clavipes]|nr:hypothetical protein TNCV_2187891 [Trichonephila clavipes]
MESRESAHRTTEDEYLFALPSGVGHAIRDCLSSDPPLIRRPRHNEILIEFAYYTKSTACRLPFWESLLRFIVYFNGELNTLEETSAGFDTLRSRRLRERYVGQKLFSG